MIYIMLNKVKISNNLREKIVFTSLLARISKGIIIKTRTTPVFYLLNMKQVRNFSAKGFNVN